MASRFSIEAVFKAVDRMTAPVSRMQNKVGKFTRSMERGFRSLDNVVGRVSSGLISGAKSAAVAGGVLIAGVGVALDRVADHADALAKRSRRLDFPIEQMQEWQFVAEQSGFTVTEYDKAVEGMAKRLGEARIGTGSLYTILKKGNKPLLRQLQGTKDVSQAMEILIEAMQKSKDPMERAALANAAFGRQGLKMANIAELGADKIAALRKEQRENGVITREQAEAAEAYNDAISSLKRAAGGFIQSVLLPMMPMLTNVVRSMREWAVANKGAISDQVLQFGRSVVENFQNIVTWATRIGIALGVFFGLAAILKTLVLIITAVNLVMALNPIGLIVIAVVALIAGITALVVKFGSFKNMLVEVGKFLINNNPFALMLNGVNTLIKKVTGFDLKKMLGERIRSFTDDLPDWIKVRLGLADDTQDATGENQQAMMQPIDSPQDRVARNIEERRTTSTAEVTIRDETKRAEVTSGELGPGLSLQQSGEF